MRVETPAQPGKEATGSRHGPGAVRQTVTATGDPIDPPTDNLMEEVLRRENLLAALRRVQANKGAPGIDDMTVEELPDLPSDSLARDPRAAAERNLCSVTGARGEHTQARGWDQDARHSHCP